MIFIPGYSVIDTLEENSTRLYKSHRSKDNTDVLIKVVKRQDTKLAHQLEHEFDLTSKITPLDALKPLALEKTDDLLALIYESFNGETLYNFYKDRTPSIKEFLTVAISISESLAKLHENGIIHKNINPSSILIEKDTHAIKITDFGIATLMPLEYFQTLPNPVIIEGSLPFISPEQTGRMNRTLDYRTDIYSLGVTFYFILTGQLPFTANDPLEWVYNHMIRIPKAPEQLNPSIPTTVSNIIMKMMAKQADDRYQSLNGLTYDLKKCLTLLDDTGFITDFQPGKNDYTGKLQISQKIFGREKEIALLLESYNNVVNTGTAHLLLVSGYSGIGKSALIKELNKPITRQKGLFVSGKFDQFKKTVPYSTIVEAFSSLVLNILGEPEIQLNKWRNTLLEALGENGQIIIDVIPQLERIIGKQPTVPKLPLLETQNRFIIVFEKFIQVFSKLEHPLTLFLDDLHWADHASLALIKQIISNPSNKYIYIVGAFRENEVLPSHPLRIFINDLENSRKAPFSQLKLSALSKENVTQLIADSLKAEVEYVKPLADLVYDKTNGNPFFTIQFLQMLHQEKLLTFEQQQWKWDINNIKAKEYTSNVVELMVLKIRHISSESQHILTHAAYIGNNISRKILSLVTEIPEELIHSKMEEPIREGLIYSYGHNYKFLHDRVQEAAYSLIPENQAPLIHLKIGRTLLTSLSKQEVEHHLFDIANHLNSANQYIDATEKNLLFRLNYLAAQKARSSIAYEAARSYLFHASSLLPKDALDSRYTDAFPVYLDLAECEYLVGNFTSAEVLYNLLLNKAGSRQDRVNVYIMRSRLYQAAGRYTDAVKVTREALSLFGVEFPDNRDELQKEFESEYSKIPTYLGGRTIHDLLDAPEVDDPDIASVISILAESLPTWYSGRPDLFPLLVIKALNICLQHGNISEASRIYSGYAMVLIAGFRDIPSGYAYSELSLLINDKYKDKKFQGLLLFVHAVYVNIWQKHIIKSDRMLDDGLNICVEAGDLAFAGYAAILKVVHEIEKGEPLNKVRQECKNKISFAIQIHNTAVETSVRGSEQFIKCLQGKTNAYGNFDDTTYSESSAIEVFKNSGLGSALAIYLIQRQTACLFFDLPEKALEYAQQVEPFQQEVAAMIVEADFHFIHALTLASLFHKEKPQQPGHYIKSITQALQLMNLWADNCPENFKHRCLLLSAELASIENKDLEAIRLYDEAILQAKNNGFVQWEALYSEFAGKFFLRKELPFIAESYLRKAYECYSKWEATGKTKQMTELYPFLKTKSSLAITESGIPVEQLDLLSITKASQTISSYINLEQLVGNLLKIGIQQAVAEKAYLFLLKDGQMLPVAEASNIEDSINVKVYNTTDVLPNTGYSQSVIQYVSRTQEKIIIDNGSSSNIFGNDEYIASTHPKSIACLPIVKQSKLTGIIYLENNLFAGAFSEDKIITLELLISQAAISIENAVLFTELTNSKQLLQDIINNSSAAIFLKDLEGKYIFVNNEYEKIFNLPKEEIVGKTAYDLWPKEMADMISNNDREVLRAGKSISLETGLKKNKNIHTYISVRFPVYDINSNIYAIGGISTDISERKQAEEALKRMNLELLKTNTDLDNFMYAASHNVKGPASSLEGLINLLDMKLYEPEELDQIIAMMKVSMSNFNQTIADLTELSKVQKLIETQDIIPNDIVAVVEDIKGELTELINNTNATLVTYAEEAPMVWFSKTNFRRILYNLILNAIIYRSPLRKPEIMIKSFQSNGYIVVSVVDNGLGIAKENMEKIFSMFKRAHSHVGGRGVGLYIVKRIIENSGGKIEVQSELGKGAIFNVYFKK